VTARCIRTTLTAEQRLATNAPGHFHPQYQVMPGKEYVVLGVSFFIGSTVYGNGPLFQICDDAGRCVSMPTALFDLVDPRPSRFWVAKRIGEADFVLWPEEFYREYFHDDLSERDAKTVATFNEVVGRLDAEFGPRVELTTLQ
jgi:hypothetical protein